MHAYIQHAHDAAEARRQRLLREIIGPAREAREPGPPAESILGPIGIVALMVISSIALTTLIY